MCINNNSNKPNHKYYKRILKVGVYKLKSIKQNNKNCEKSFMYNIMFYVMDISIISPHILYVIILLYHLNDHFETSTNSSYTYTISSRVVALW